MAKAEDLDMTLTSSSAQVARKRRMDRRAGKPEEATKKLRIGEDGSSSDSELSVSSGDNKTTNKTLSKDALAKIPGVKKQARYVPAVPMSKEELTLWRKEARRLRNRESAAASRQKTQKRITELEGVVETLTTKYEAALRRIVELEAAAASAAAWRPSKYATPSVSPVLAPQTVSPPLSPRESFSLDEEESAAAATISLKSSSPSLHLPTATITKISRHDAAKISGSAGALMTTTSYSNDNSSSNDESSPWSGSQEADHRDYPLATDMPALGVSQQPQQRDENDYPLAMDDMELGDFLTDAMDHVVPTMAANHGEAVPAFSAVAACDALHMLEDLPHPPMNLPPP